jgi:hypothetical protein
VHATHTSAFAISCSGVAERDNREPLGRAGKPTECIIFVTRMLHDTSEGTGVQCLHQERANSADDRRQ